MFEIIVILWNFLFYDYVIFGFVFNINLVFLVDNFNGKRIYWLGNLSNLVGIVVYFLYLLFILWVLLV